MAGKQLGAYYNTIGFRTDMKQLRQVRSQHKAFAKEIQGYYSKVRINPMVNVPKMPKQFQPYNVTPPLSPETKVPRQPKMPVDNDAKWKEVQSARIETFIASNKHARNLKKTEQDALRIELMQTKNARELNVAIAHRRGKYADLTAELRRINRLQEQQNFMAKRMNSSWLQMAGSVASVYTAVNAVRSSIATGMEFESMAKSFVVVSKDSADAQQNLMWVREESQRLGLSLVDASKSYSGFLAAMSNKMDTQAIREVFTGVSEASVALGLSAEQQSRIFLAVKQMALI